MEPVVQCSQDDRLVRPTSEALASVELPTRRCEASGRTMLRHEPNIRPHFAAGAVAQCVLASSPNC